MGAENHVEDMGEDVNRLLWKVRQRPVRYTVRTRIVAELETHDVFVNLIRGGSLAGLRKKDLNATSTESITAGSKGSVRAKSRLPDCLQGLRFSQSLRDRFPCCDQGNGVGNLITRLDILYINWFSGSRDSSLALHWSILHSLRRLTTDLWRRLNWAFKAGFLVICNCFAAGFSGEYHLECRMESEGIGLHAGDAWELTLLAPSERRRRSCQRICRLPSRYEISDQT